MHHPINSTWFRDGGLLLCVGTIFALCLPLPAADETPQVTLQFLDEETDAPLVRARIVIDSRENYFPRPAWVFAPPDPLGAPKPRWHPPVWPEQYAPQEQATTDEAGAVTVSLPHPDAAIAVLHEKGVAWLTISAMRPQVSTVSVKLQRWARLEGRVFKQGKPCAGAMIGMTRTVSWHSFKFTFDTTPSFRFPSLRHGLTTVSDSEGRFTFKRLIPTNIECEKGDAPYFISQLVTPGHTLKPGEQGQGVTFEASGYDAPAFDIRPRMGEYSATIEQGVVFLQPGQCVKMELLAIPRCVREVRGRFVWTDGRPVKPSRDLPSDSFGRTVSFHPSTGATGMTASFGGSEIQEDGRFAAILPLAGEWHVSVDSLSVLDGDKTSPSFCFTLRSSEDGGEKGAPVDLGDIVLKRYGTSSAGKTR